MPEPLVLGRVLAEREDDVLEGVLLCPVRACQREHPIIDGIPIIVADIRAQVSAQLTQLRAPGDLSLFTESLLGDCAGPGSDFERERYHLSVYARGHYGDLDRERPAPAEGGLVPLVAHALGMLSSPPAGLWLDVGCSVGRASFELAARTGDLVLGVDLNIAMLRLARRAALTGRIVHPLRRVGLVYDHRDIEVDLPHRDRVDVWACDVMALPFDQDTFDGVLSMNVVDCVASPVAHLMELGRVLRPGAEAALATPYDWSLSATPIEAWIGGHSQRAEHGGDSALQMRRLLSPGEVPPEAAPGLELVREHHAFPWHVYVHERATMRYDVHLMIARALASARHA